MKDVIIMYQNRIIASCSLFQNLFWMTFKLNCILIQIQRRKPTLLSNFANQPVNILIIKKFSKEELPHCNSCTLAPDTKTITLFKQQLKFVFLYIACQIRVYMHNSGKFKYIPSFNFMTLTYRLHLQEKIKNPKMSIMLLFIQQNI